MESKTYDAVVVIVAPAVPEARSVSGRSGGVDALLAANS